MQAFFIVLSSKNQTKLSNIKIVLILLMLEIYLFNLTNLNYHLGPTASSQTSTGSTVTSPTTKATGKVFYYYQKSNEILTSIIIKVILL